MNINVFSSLFLDGENQSWLYFQYLKRYQKYIQSFFLVFFGFKVSILFPVHEGHQNPKTKCKVFCLGPKNAKSYWTYFQTYIKLWTSMKFGFTNLEVNNKKIKSPQMSNCLYRSKTKFFIKIQVFKPWHLQDIFGWI